ncbi:MAG: hypothetical protein GX986_09400 [Firmicutes bacterium]|jgi:hypothetical protein|nr:hypothetical protein [Bacillota bacterium]
MEYEVLPKEYWDKQNYLLYVYSVLADMLRQADSKRLSDVAIRFDNVDQAISFEHTKDIFGWLDDNGYHDESLDFFSRHVFFLLLRDFCYYAYESISCAQRGKVTVAYTLLRKPLRDNLFYMEWLLADAEELYHGLLHESVENYDVSSRTLSRKKIRRIIKEASSNSNMGEAMNVQNIIYRFRFSSKAKWGLQRIWNQSIHLVTRNVNYRTEEGNLNFIFANEDVWTNYWGYYYLIIPYLMAYVMEICEALFLRYIEVDTSNLVLNRSIRWAKFASAMPNLDGANVLKNGLYELYRALEEDDASLGHECPKCEENVLLTLQVLDQMINGWFVVCPYCHREQSVCKYHTDYRILVNES